ncbi:nitrate- and nitrite sensing domain-containing protein [Azospira restricta]|uniref:Nitrate- and nitrite sensing domain-containing protein n=1 Tax=Azospira restricta TaxID=404405 RepID=A0A974PWX7_9RHOO|nr:nitrate- and nitrite sensing domain-containing protein [Azospira restricta]QRJ62465.1 nitrate- and nitrite sensing domain-containing protein [Azospira restricta]
MSTYDLTYLLVPAAAVPAAFWLARRHAGNAPVSPAALAACGSLLRLVSHLQQHRGLSSGWLAGDEGFAARMMARRADIEALLAALSPLVLAEEKYARPCMTANDLALFRHQWRTLVDTLADGSVEQNIGRHTRLITRVLDWLDAFGEARIELPAGRRLPPGLVRNYTHRLPALAECLGQARALGSSVAVQKRCPAVSRVRLMFLAARAETLLDQAGAAAGPVGLRASEAVRGLVVAVRTGILDAGGVSLSADAYFAQATRAIDAVFAWAGDCAADIERLLGERGASFGAVAPTAS